jgi:hypothetical protein
VKILFKEKYKNTELDGQKVLERAFLESKGETIDIIVEQEIAGVNPRMFYWWLGQIKDRYTQWYPEAHLSVKTETLPDGRNIELIEENVGAYHVIFRFLPTEKGVIILTSDNKPMGKLVHIAEPTPKGMKLRSIFTFPAKTPRAFIESMQGHCISEMQDLPRFLPKLYTQVSGQS